MLNTIATWIFILAAGSSVLAIAVKVMVSI